MKGVSFGGTSVFPNEEIINISQLNGVALVGGIGNFSKVDLGKALAGKRANVVRVSATLRKLFPVAVLRKTLRQ